jgi:Trk-type K+ transport system membrane component
LEFGAGRDAKRLGTGNRYRRQKRTGFPEGGIEMSPRFISNLALGLAGAVIVAASQAFSASVTGWLTFGVSLGALSLLAMVQLYRAPGRVQRLLDIATGALAVWSAVASVVYNGTTLTWLSFGEGLGFVGLAVIGLVAHELRTERVVHAFEAIPAEARDSGQADELSAAA